jgi:hypothetical protein
VLTACVTAIDHTGVISNVVYWLCFGALNTLSIVSLFTGFKVNFTPFKLCPVIFTTSSILILLGSYL